MIERGVSFLEKNRVINIALVIAYVAAIIALHDFMVQQSVIIMNAVGLESYDYYVARISLVLGVLILAFMSYQLFKNKSDTGKKLFYLFVTLILMVLHFHWMFEMNIEIIHSLQYGVLGILLFPLTRKIGFTVVLSIPAMLLDEWYQYQVLYPDYVEYFEFNDIIMNILGLSLFCIILWIGGAKLKTVAIHKYSKHIGINIFLLYSVLCFLLIISGLIVFYPEQATEKTFLILNQLESNDFWLIHKFTKAKYHVLTPIESFIGITALSIFYTGLDFKFKSN